MTRPRKVDEQLWEDGEEKLSSDHVVERFFSQHVHDGEDAGPRAHAAPRAKRRPPAPPEADE